MIAARGGGPQAGCATTSGPSLRRNEQGEGVGHQADAYRQIAQPLSIGLGEDARTLALSGPALDRIGIQQFNLAGKGLTAEEHGQHEAKKAQAAGGLEGYQAQAVAAQARARSQAAEHSAKV